jgi:hypothetical protein
MMKTIALVFGLAVGTVGVSLMLLEIYFWVQDVRSGRDRDHRH